MSRGRGAAAPAPDGEESPSCWTSTKDYILGLDFVPALSAFRRLVLAVLLLLLGDLVASTWEDEIAFGRVPVYRIFYLVALVIVVWTGSGVVCGLLYALLEPLSKTPLWQIYFYASSYDRGPLRWGLAAILLRRLWGRVIDKDSLESEGTLFVIDRCLVAVIIAAFASGLRRAAMKIYTVNIAHKEYLERCVGPGAPQRGPRQELGHDRQPAIRLRCPHAASKSWSSCRTRYARCSATLGWSKRSKPPRRRWLMRGGSGKPLGACSGCVRAEGPTHRAMLFPGSSRRQRRSESCARSTMTRGRCG